MPIRNAVGGTRIIGTKFYTYFDNDIEATIYRLINYKESKGYYTLMNVADHKVRTLSEEELCGRDSKFTLLNPDGLMTFTIVKMDDVNAKDVIIGLHDNPKDTNIYEPLAVCRQCVEDIFVNKTSVYDGTNFSIGISVSRDTCPANVDIRTFLACNSAEHMVTTAIYLDDTMEDIERYIFPGINIRKFNNVLGNTKAYMDYNSKGRILGTVGTIKELMELNNFMADFHRVFKVAELYLSIEEGQEHLDLGGAIELEKYVGEKITQTYVLKYSREFRLDSIKRKYVLVYPLANNYTKSVYVIGYDTVDDRTFVADKYQE